MGEDGGSVILAAAHPHPGEQVAHAHAVGEVLEGDQVVHVGLDALPPPPQVDDAGAEAAV